MLEWLLEIDRALFLFINGDLANPVTDFIMPIVTNGMFLRLTFGLALGILIARGGKRFVWVVVFSLLVVVLTDQSSSTYLKPFFERIRPCKTMDVHLLVNCGAGLSFPSSHAANLFGQAFFFSLLYRRYSLYFLAFAFLVGISRVFVGVHYPLDVLGGMILGGIEAALMVLIFKTLISKNKLKPAPYIQ
ncbi:MAG: phosphatase PAP2 family protein [FCB group bacterium]|nr:phosphatase PAP2 family protein [FCB group bacterium]